MKHITKRKIPSRLLAAIILASVLVLMIIATVVVNIAARGTDETQNTTQTTVPDILENEATQSGLALAYPMINNKSQIASIDVVNESGRFGFMKYDGENYFTLYYFEEGNDEVQIYLPEICNSEDGFDYTSLFAIETGDGYSQFTLVDYLCMALQSPYFDQRVALAVGSTAEETEQLRKAQFKEYGFDGENEHVVEVRYTDAFGAASAHKIRIGKKSATGTGHYFMVDDRPYVYSSLNNFFDYALKNMTEFLKPLLVAEGLSSDKGFGPYLTTDYRQWVNALHDGSCECDKYECECKGECTENCDCSDVCRVTVTDDESKVIAYTDVISTTLGVDLNEYGSVGVDLIEIDLANAKEWLTTAKSDYDDYLKKYEEYESEYEEYKLNYEALSDKEKEERRTSYAAYVEAFEKYKRNFVNYKINYENQKKNYERMINVLAGREIGKYTDGNELIYTLASHGRFIDFGVEASVEYQYVITEIEAILTDNGEISRAGVSAEDAGSSLVKVIYTASVGGKAVSDEPLHAVINLESLAMPINAARAISSTPIGECNVSFNVTYTADNAFSRNGKYTVVEITEIYDQSFKEIDKATTTSIVGFRYSIEVDGIAVGESKMLLDLSTADTKIKSAFKNLEKGAVSFTLDEQSVHYEMFMNYSTYKVSEIDSFLTRELISAFRFQNSSERDPYYGESLYENCMNDEHKLYGLNSSVCETVAKILGGLSDESASATASGLSGDSVVAIGLTPEVKEKYGLYAYTIYFELPRGITAYEPEGSEDSDEEVLDDYKHDSTLGFYLYVSEVDTITNTRYIASDLYDVVTRVPAEDFVFLDYDFENFWARRNIILMDVSDINYFGIEFNLEDVKGNYMFELLQPSSSKENLEISVTANGTCTENKLIEYLENPQYSKYNGAASITEFYEYMSGASIEDHKAVLPDSLGVANFREAMRMIYFMSYTDVLPEEDRTRNPDNMVMRIILKLEQTTPNASPYTYVYEFYTLEKYDRRILVSIHQEDDNGNRVGNMQVSDFYISMFTFKKLVDNFNGVLNAEIIEPNVGYIGDKKQ